MDENAPKRPDLAALVPGVYEELRRRAAAALRQEDSGHTLQPTALVHECVVKLLEQSRVDWAGRTHLIALAAQAMRRILVDHHRGKQRAKRGGGWARITLTSAAAPDPDDHVHDLEVVESALRKLEQLDPRQARIVELRFFADMSVDQIAQVLCVSSRTVDADWAHARAWLARELARNDCPGPE